MSIKETIKETSTAAEITRDYLDARLNGLAEAVVGLRAYVGDTPAQIDVIKEVVSGLRAHMDAVLRSHDELHKQRDLHVDLMFANARESVIAALASADRAISKAEAATDRRLEGMNEFRKALNDFSITLMPRLEAEGMVTELKEKIEALVIRLADRDVMPRTESEKLHIEMKERVEWLAQRINDRSLMPRAESEKMHADTKEKLDGLTLRMNSREARGSGRGEVWAYVVAAVSVIIAIVTVMNKIFGNG